MTTVVLFQHQGVSAAVPASQIVRLDAGEASGAGPTACLWPGQEVESGRLLVFRGAEQNLRLWCDQVRIHEVEERALCALPVLLCELMRDMPYIVGAAWIEERAYWLVDLSRVARSTH